MYESFSERVCEYLDGDIVSLSLYMRPSERLYVFTSDCVCHHAFVLLGASVFVSGRVSVGQG